MTFGTDWGWGADREETRRIFDAYVDRGGNFIDTANQYTNGSAEQLVGELAAGKRERLVLATKYTLATRAGDPNAGGNHRKSMVRSVEQSLGVSRPTTSTFCICTCGTDSRRPRRSCAALTISSAQARCCTPASPTRLPGRYRACRRSPISAAGRPSSLCRSRTACRAHRRARVDPDGEEMGLGVIPWSPLGERRTGGQIHQGRPRDWRRQRRPGSSAQERGAANGMPHARRSRSPRP